MIVKKVILNLNLRGALDVVNEKLRVARELFEGRCYVCRKPFGNGFAFHHNEYDPNRKTHKDFKNTIDYNRYVLPEVIAHAERFYLLCKICHARIDQPRYGYLGHITKDRLERLFEVARKTIPGPRKTRTQRGNNESVSPST